MADTALHADGKFISQLHWYYDVMHLGIVVLNKNLQMVFANGWMLGRIPSPPPSDMSVLFGRYHVHNRHMHKLKELVADAVDRRQSRLVSQAFHKWLIPLDDPRFDDGLMRQSCTVSPIRCPHTGTVYALVQIRDESDAVLKNIKLQRSRSKWMHVNKMEAMSTMVRGIAHHFNNLLGTIMGNTEILQTGQVPRELTEKCLDDILGASMAARNVVRRLVTFSRESNIELQPVDLGQVVSDALDLSRAMVPKTIALEFSSPTKEMIIHGNAPMLEQAVISLVFNAVQAVAPQTGRIQVVLERVSGVESRELDDCRGSCVRLSIRDNGRGIDPSIAHKIFDPYFTTHGFEYSSGLGLAVVHGIVRNHNARIDFTSTPGKETVFTLLFPEK